MTTAKLAWGHPLAIHRRNNLVLSLILLSKLEYARQVLASNWRLNAPRHANTTPRIAFFLHVIALLESQPNTPFLGQLESLSENSEWCCFPGKGWMARRDEREYPSWVFD